MADKTKILELLCEWHKLMQRGEAKSISNAKEMKNGLRGRIRRTTGTPVVFDFETYQQQQKIQNTLCQQLPDLADLIRSTPEIMDGHAWTRKDFIELYFSHYRLVMQKIRRIISSRQK